MTTCLLVHAAGERYLLRMAEARQVTLPPPVASPLPHAPRAVRGLFSLRGEILPLVDLARLLGAGEVAHPGAVVVVDTPEGSLGLAVDAVPVPVGVTGEREPSERAGTAGLSPLPAGHPDAGAHAAWVDVAALGGLLGGGG